MWQKKLKEYLNLIDPNQQIADLVNKVQINNHGSD